MRSSWLYQDRNSLLHRLHPMSKLIGLLLLFTPQLLTNPLASILVLVVAVVVALVAARLARTQPA